MRIVLFSLFVFIFGVSKSQTIQISLFNSKNVNAYTLSIQQGSYLLICDGETLAEYKKNSIFFINRVGNKIEVRDKQSQIGIFREVHFSNQDENGMVHLRGVNPSTQSREYNDAIIFSISDSRLKAINHIDLEKYIAAVIEAEGGISAPIEYYKAQGVLVRTYTIKNIYKHAEEGFNLCDEVHCQAYHGRSAQNPEIYRATKETTGKVLIDSDSVLAMTPFHSSCGGQTSAAGIYWQSDLSYLKSVSDPFCLDQRNAKWENKITKSEWNSFLRSKGITDPEKYTSFSVANRQKYFSEKYKITLRQIREQFGLRSTFFTFETLDNYVVFKGKGYGHGIGMCQIGAMEMARVGYTYVDILHFYFQHVSLTDYREMELNRY
jgi:stage II sporulation protein D